MLNRCSTVFNTYFLKIEQRSVFAQNVFMNNVREQCSVKGQYAHKGRPPPQYDTRVKIELED